MWVVERSWQGKTGTGLMSEMAMFSPVLCSWPKELFCKAGKVNGQADPS
jgi:hypothetical protein